MADTKKIVEIVYKLTDKASSKLKGLGSGFASMGKNILTSKLSLAALTGLFVASVRDFSTLQTSVTNVGTLFGATTKQVSELTKEILSLSKEVPSSAKDLSDSLFDVVSAGVAVEDSMEFLKSAAMLATAGVTTTGVAVDGLTSLMNAYSLSSKDAIKISDLLFQSQKEGKTTVEELSNAIGNVAPIAASLKVPMDELLGTVAALTKNGIATSQAVTGVRSTLTALMKDSSKVTKEAKKLGVEFSAQAVKTKGLTAVLKEVVKATNGDEKALTKLFGRVEAVNTVLALSKNGFEDLDAVLGSVKESTNATSEAYALQSATMAFQTKVLKNNVLALSRSLLNDLAPSFTTVLEKMNEFLKPNTEEDKLNELITERIDKIKTLEKAIDDQTIKVRNSGILTLWYQDQVLQGYEKELVAEKDKLEQLGFRKIALEGIHSGEVLLIEDAKDLGKALDDNKVKTDEAVLSLKEFLGNFGDLFDNIKVKTAETSKAITVDLVNPIIDFFADIGKAFITPGNLEAATKKVEQDYLFSSAKAKIQFERGIISRTELISKQVDSINELNEALLDIEIQAKTIRDTSGGIFEIPTMIDANKAINAIREVSGSAGEAERARFLDKADSYINTSDPQTVSVSKSLRSQGISQDPQNINISGEMVLKTEDGTQLATMVYEKQTELLKNGEITERR